MGWRLNGYYVDYSIARKFTERHSIDICQGHDSTNDWDNSHMHFPINN